MPTTKQRKKTQKPDSRAFAATSCSARVTNPYLVHATVDVRLVATREHDVHGDLRERSQQRKHAMPNLSGNDNDASRGALPHALTTAAAVVRHQRRHPQAQARPRSLPRHHNANRHQVPPPMQCGTLHGPHTLAEGRPARQHSLSHHQLGHAVATDGAAAITRRTSSALRRACPNITPNVVHTHRGMEGGGNRGVGNRQGDDRGDSERSKH